jgi:hypothetical protein
VERTFLVSYTSPEVRQPLLKQPLTVTQIHYTGWPGKAFYFFQFHPICFFSDSLMIFWAM